MFIGAIHRQTWLDIAMRSVRAQFEVAVADRPEAVAFARTNGWIVGDRTWCPLCAATHTTRRTA